MFYTWEEFIYKIPEEKFRPRPEITTPTTLLSGCMIKMGDKYQCITSSNFGIKWTVDPQFCDEFSKDPASKIPDYKNFLEDCNIGLTIERSKIISTPSSLRTTIKPITTTNMPSKLQYNRPIPTNREKYHTERQNLTFNTTVAPSTTTIMSFNQRSNLGQKDFSSQQYEPDDPDYDSYNYEAEYDDYAKPDAIGSALAPARPEQPKQHGNGDHLILPYLDRTDEKLASNQHSDSSTSPHGMNVQTPLESILKPGEQDVSGHLDQSARTPSNQGTISTASPTYRQSRPQHGYESSNTELTLSRHTPAGTGSLLPPTYGQPDSQSGDVSGYMRPAPSVGEESRLGTPQQVDTNRDETPDTYQPGYQDLNHPMGRPAIAFVAPIAAVQNPYDRANSPTQYGSYAFQQTAHSSPYDFNGAPRYPASSGFTPRPQDVPFNQWNHLPVYPSPYPHVPQGGGYQPPYYANPYGAPVHYADPYHLSAVPQYELIFSPPHGSDGSQQPYPHHNQSPHQPPIDDRYPNVGLPSYAHSVTGFNPSLAPAFNVQSPPGLKPPPPPGARRNINIGVNNNLPYRSPQQGLAYASPTSSHRQDAPVIDYELIANPTLCNLTKINLPEKCVNVDEFIKEFEVLPIDDMISTFDNKSVVDHMGDIYTDFKDVPLGQLFGYLSKKKQVTANSPRKSSTDSAKALFNVATKLKNMDALQQCDYLVENSRSYRTALCSLIEDCRPGPPKSKPIFCQDE
uniref:Uncharacterized protein n=1 Tax=Romanomermis culicivorax TaxID=13658 RepID=A0A915HTY6_ROMCU